MKKFRWAAHDKKQTISYLFFLYPPNIRHPFRINIEKSNGDFRMNDLLVEILNTYGYLGIAFLIMIENIFPPIPSEVILTFSGFMTTFTQMNLPGVVASATVGSLAGAIFLYELGSILSMEKIQSLVNGPVGKALHLDIHDIEKAISWFDSKGNYTVFLCRFIPIVRSLISIPAGIAQMRLGPFFLMTTLGSLIWNFVLIFLGATAGSSWRKAVQYFHSYSQAAKIVLVLFSFVGLLLFLRRQFKKKTST